MSDQQDDPTLEDPPASAGTIRKKMQGAEDDWQADWLAVDWDHKIRFDHSTNRWHMWNGILWAADQTHSVEGQTMEMAKRKAETAFTAGDDDNAKRYRKLRTVVGVKHALEALSYRADYKTDGSDWDQDPNLLGCENGIVDLRLNALVEPDPSSKVSKSTGHTFVPMNDWSEFPARCPTFSKSLDEWTSGDRELSMFYVLWFGYSLFGHTQEPHFLILQGGGRNGKGALVHAIKTAFGEYDAKAGESLYMRTKWGVARSDGPRADLIALKGNRIAIMPEPPGQAFNSEMIKAHTGGDDIVARALHSNVILRWKPTHTITFLVNDLPSVNDVGISMADRVLVADFRERYTGDKRDGKLYDKLAAEADGILAALCLAAKGWYEHGLAIPQRVLVKSNDYISTNDPVGRVLDEVMVLEQSAKTSAKMLYDAYADWFTREGLEGDPMSSTAFALALGKHDIQKTRTAAGMVYLGIRPKTALETAYSDE